MKLTLITMLAAVIAAPGAFADSKKCDKKKDCDKKDESTMLAHCGKDDCGKKKKDCDKDKEEATLLAKCGGCEKKECKEGCDCEKCKAKKAKKDEGTLLAGKCKKNKDCDKDDEEATLLAA